MKLCIHTLGRFLHGSIFESVDDRNDHHSKSGHILWLDIFYRSITFHFFSKAEIHIRWLDIWGDFEIRWQNQLKQNLNSIITPIQELVSQLSFKIRWKSLEDHHSVFNPLILHTSFPSLLKCPMNDALTNRNFIMMIENQIDWC
jgi:hypothetical protein